MTTSSKRTIIISIYIYAIVECPLLRGLVYGDTVWTFRIACYNYTILQVSGAEGYWLIN